jgi:hypothetical protein
MLEFASQATFSLAMMDVQGMEMFLNHNITFRDDIVQNKLLNSHVHQEAFSQIPVHRRHPLLLEFSHLYENPNEFVGTSIRPRLLSFISNFFSLFM